MFQAKFSLAINAVFKQTQYVVYISFVGLYKTLGARGSLVFNALGYKHEGRGFETR
jgi:hypothetical protein